jgi:hypothetical protein
LHLGITSQSEAKRRADPYLDTDVIDARAPRFNQAVIALLALVAFHGWWPLLAILATSSRSGWPAAALPPVPRILRARPAAVLGEPMRTRGRRDSRT